MEKFFDAHAHYTDEAFDADRDKLISSLPSNGVVGFINAGTDLDSSRESIHLAEKYSGAYAAAGIYPGECSKYTDENSTLAALEQLLSHPRCVALGEIGLDFHYDDVPRDVQRHWLDLQLELAKKLKLPVELHDREAHGACVEAVSAHAGTYGMFHSYSGSAETAAELVRLGWYISFSGTVTFKNASRLREVVSTIPRDRILIETDCPYLAPVPMRGKRNDSSNLLYTASVISELLGLTTSEVASLTCENAERLFNINLKG